MDPQVLRGQQVLPGRQVLQDPQVPLVPQARPVRPDLPAKLRSRLRLNESASWLTRVSGLSNLAVAAAERGRNSLRMPDALDQHVDAIAAPE